MDLEGFLNFLFSDLAKLLQNSVLPTFGSPITAMWNSLKEKEAVLREANRMLDGQIRDEGLGAMRNRVIGKVCHLREFVNLHCKIIY